MAQTLNNVIEIFAFLNENRSKTFNNKIKRYFFKAQITYFYKNNEETFFTKMRVEHAFDSGEIEVYPVEGLNANDYHLNFMPKFQNMKYDKSNNVLEIKGNSPNKMGDYLVLISNPELFAI